MKSFDSLDVLLSIKAAVKAKGYVTPTPIQAKAIPHLLEGRDLLGIAQTGTGKTAAFSLPLITMMEKNKKRMGSKKVRTLILTPTRELATQIENNIKEYSEGLGMRSKVVFGGVGAQPQIKAIARGLEFVIATPGRLLDLMQQRHIVFDDLEYLVLDEADRMLDMGFIHDIKKIISAIPEKRQTLFFSATMPRDIEKLAGSMLKNPIKVEVTPEASTVDRISQSVSFLDKDDKLKLLEDIVLQPGFDRGLVFVRTKHGADKIVRKLLQNSIIAAAIHGNKSQNNRELALKRFKKGDLKLLIATDIAARGIDIDELDCVINYNLPEDSKSYVHRIGRTARAGREGVAISFCDQSEILLLRGIEKTIKQKIPVNLEQPYHIELSENYKKPPKQARPKRSFGSKKPSSKTRNKSTSGNR